MSDDPIREERVRRGSVQMFRREHPGAPRIAMTEGVHYTVDYATGIVTLTDKWPTTEDPIGQQ